MAYGQIMFASYRVTRMSSRVIRQGTTRNAQEYRPLTYFTGTALKRFAAIQQKSDWAIVD